MTLPTVEDYQTLEEYRIIQGITDESHIIYKILMNSQQIISEHHVIERLKDMIEMHEHQIKVIQKRYDESDLKDDSYLNTIQRHAEILDELKSIYNQENIIV